jgi:cyclic beta-1,2-glucan synthetase
LRDLVILNDRGSSYAQDLQGAIEALVRKINAPRAPGLRGEMGQVFALRADLLSHETLRVLPAIARVVLVGRRGDLASQLSRVREISPVPSIQRIRASLFTARPQTIAARRLSSFNGL